MLLVHRQTKARRDLKDIWQYSYRNWGEKRADLYLDDIEDGFQRLAENPKLGVSINHIRKGYRQLSVNSHVIIYRATSQHISIVRVLGETMNIIRQL